MIAQRTYDKHSMVLSALALALSKGNGLAIQAGKGSLNETQWMLVSEAICKRVTEDLRFVFKRGETLIKSTIPEVHEQCADGLISHAECFASYLAEVSKSDFRDEKEEASALHVMLFDLEEKLREIHCPESWFGKGCLISG